MAEAMETRRKRVHDEDEEELSQGEARLGNDDGPAIPIGTDLCKPPDPPTLMAMTPAFCVEEGIESPRATRTFFSLRLTRSSTTFKAREYRGTDAWIFYFDNDSIRRKEPATRSVAILFLHAEAAERRGAETS